MKRWLFSVGWVLLGLLAVSALVISGGKEDFAVNPTASSYGVSGASALADLLRLRGYDIVVDGHAKPTLNKNDAVVAFQLSDASDLSDPEQIQNTDKSIQDQIKRGGAVFWLPLNPDFEAASASVQTPKLYGRIDGKTRSLTGSATASDSSSDSSIPLLAEKGLGRQPSNDGIPFVSADRIGKGYEIAYADGIGLTNRFLDKANNAQTFIEILKSYAPAAHRVVFTEATFGRVQQVGFLETLGPWAEGSWYQLIFLFFVVVFTLNQRFGLPVRLRKTQVGGRELVDALTDTMIRAKATGIGLESAYHRADTKIRKVAKLPRDAAEGERDRVLPQEILSRLGQVKTASTMTDVRPSDALDLVVKLEKAVGDFEAAHGSTLVKSRKRRL